MRKALILVDIQYDFLPGGALAVPDGDAVIPFANAKMHQYDLVVATQDWHPPDHQSFASQHEGALVGDTRTLDGLEQTMWPVHCVQDTHGAEFPDLLDLSRVDEVIRKGTNRDIDSYSGFFDNARRHATELHAVLQEQEIGAVALVGLATDYCVRFTALDALDLGYQTTVWVDGVRGVDLKPGDCAAALDAMRQAGATLQ